MTIVCLPVASGYSEHRRIVYSVRRTLYNNQILILFSRIRERWTYHVINEDVSLSSE